MLEERKKDVSLFDEVDVKHTPLLQCRYIVV
jgi:hypothetical protein